MERSFAYLRIYEELRNAVINGIYPYGTKLPSKRAMADSKDVSVITVERAYSILADEGYVESKERSGYYVIYKRDDSFLSHPEAYIRTEPGIPARLPDDMFPLSAYAKAVRKVMNDNEDLLYVKSPNTGTVQLKTSIKAYLLRSKGISVDTSRIVIGSGSEYLYGMIILLLGRDRVFALEDPSYSQIKMVYTSNDVKLEQLRLGSDGILSSELNSSKADVLHVTPYNSFPSGISASASKRYEYIRWAEKGRRFIIEDDYASEYSLSRKNEDTLFLLSKSDNIIYMNTFSRTIAPSIRIGYMILPESLTQVYEERLGEYSCTVPVLEQLVLSEILNSGEFERHINRVRRKMRKQKSVQ